MENIQKIETKATILKSYDSYEMLIIQVKCYLNFTQKIVIFLKNYKSNILCNEIRCDIIYIHVNCELDKISSRLCKEIVEGFFWKFLTNMMKIKGGCQSR